jgi:UDPglucose--hexose-1-phosphate uridylyltransferase
MGGSNPHPHGQVWSLSEIPTFPATELENLKKYSQESEAMVIESDSPRGPGNRPCLLCEYANHELSIGEEESRLVIRNEHWIALVPYWAVWPFELLGASSHYFLFIACLTVSIVLPYHRHIPSLDHLNSQEKTSLASIIRGVTIRYDNLFSTSFAYSMGIHQRPTPSADPSVLGEGDEAHLHLHFNPPLVRSASVRKFLVG